MFILPKLPYEKNALEPYISEETLEFHYGKHHQTYVNNLNNLTAGTGFDNNDLEKIIEESNGVLFNNAAQVYNHTFYWNCLRKGVDNNQPSGNLLSQINKDFGSLDEFTAKFSASAIGNFGSGWTWLVKNTEGKLEIVNTDDAKTVITTDNIPLLVIDVWEHAYYVDYRNARPKYVENFWNLVNWEFVEGNLK